MHETDDKKFAEKMEELRRQDPFRGLTLIKFFLTLAAIWVFWVLFAVFLGYINAQCGGCMP